MLTSLSQPALLEHSLRSTVGVMDPVSLHPIQISQCQLLTPHSLRSGKSWHQPCQRSRSSAQMVAQQLQFLQALAAAYLIHIWLRLRQVVRRVRSMHQILPVLFHRLQMDRLTPSALQQITHPEHPPLPLQDRLHLPAAQMPQLA